MAKFKATLRPFFGALALVFTFGCTAGILGNNRPREANKTTPKSFGAGTQQGVTSVAAQKHWDGFFAEAKLSSLIASAIQRNQELNIRFQEIIIARAEVMGARGAYLPNVALGAGGGIEKVGRRTSQGVSDRAHGVPEHLADLRFGLIASWEVDIWGRLRNARKAANYRYLASIEARNFVITEVVAEVASSYWDLVALDKQLEILNSNIELYQSALDSVILKKEAARGTQLEVERFQAELLKNRGRVYQVEQQRILVENRINFLLGRFPQKVARDDSLFAMQAPAFVETGLPSALLENRPDVREATNILEAAKLDTKVAKARFYPSLSIEAGAGYQSFNAKHLLDTPQSLAYHAAGNLVAPLLNRAAIKADYQSANARQIQAVYNYERTLLRAYTDVVNQLATLDRLTQRYNQLEQQVKALQNAIDMATILFGSARADYTEVLLTRRDYLDAQIELVETKKQQLQAVVGIYRALGGGWRTRRSKR